MNLLKILWNFINNIIEKFRTNDDDENGLINGILKKDNYGEYCYEVARFCNDPILVEKLQDAVIKRDKTGYMCYWFAYNVKNADIMKLEDAVIKKDKTGEYCYLFAKDVKFANDIILEKAVIEKDINGKWCCKFYKLLAERNFLKRY